MLNNTFNAPIKQEVNSMENRGKKNSVMAKVLKVMQIDNSRSDHTNAPNGAYGMLTQDAEEE